MFHAAHVSFLEEAAKLGDYLLVRWPNPNPDPNPNPSPSPSPSPSPNPSQVGVHADSVLHNKRGGSYPILNLNERVLSVLACGHVSDVVIGPPRHITKEMLAALQVTRTQPQPQLQPLTQPQPQPQP